MPVLVLVGSQFSVASGVRWDDQILWEISAFSLTRRLGRAVLQARVAGSRTCTAMFFPLFETVVSVRISTAARNRVS